MYAPHPLHLLLWLSFIMERFCTLKELQQQVRPFLDEVAQYSGRQQRCRLLDEGFHQKSQGAGCQPVG